MKPFSGLNPAVTYHFNVLNVMKLRDHLRWVGRKTSEPTLGFHMNYYKAWIGPSDYQDKSGHDCDTVACIAGHAVFLKEKHCTSSPPSTKNYFNTARDWLGLTDREAGYLFLGVFMHKPIDGITLDDAIFQLDHMIATGEIN